ncbi:MAG: YCF48-related protein [Ignavibacteria bacterium]
MKTLFIFLAICLFATGALSQSYQDWKWLHQSPQGNELRWVKMWDVNTIYAIGGKGTFIKTTNRGANWFVNHTAGRTSGIPIQRADLRNAWFFNQSTGIVIGSYGSILRTTDGGLTFDSTGNPAPTNTTFTGISFINNLTGYVVCGLTDYRLMKTTNGGITWNNNIGTTPGYSNPYELHAFTENKLIVFNQLGDNFITTNGGFSWTTYPIGNLVNFNKAVFLDANTGYACGDWGRCRYTNDGGYTWANMAGILFDRNIHFTDIKYRDNTVYLTGNSNYIYHSSNHGDTWDSIAFMAPSAQPLWSNSYYSSDFSITADTMITVGAKGSIHQTLGTFKQPLGQYLKTGNMRDVWSSANAGVLLAVGAPSVSTVTQDQILRSTNSGNNWTVVSPSATSNAEFYSIDMIDDNTGYICGNRSAVYRTTNGGVNWDSLVIPNMPAGIILSKVDFVNAQTGWLFSRYTAGNDSTIFKTTNSGTTWTKQKINANTTGNTIYSACMLDENNGWLLSSRPRAWKTTNGGAVWDSTLLGDNYLAGSLYDIKMLNAQTGYCVGSNNRVYKTTNGGATPWSNVSFSSTTVITNYAVEVRNQQECVVMGTYGTGYYTSNGGLSWTKKFLQSSISDIYGSYLSQDGILYAVTLLDSYIFKNSSIFTTGINTVSENVPVTIRLKQNYPNPFNPRTVIGFQLPRHGGSPTSNVVIKIYDVTGREVQTLVNETLNAGDYKITFDGSGLTSGVYYYKITAGEFSETRKMILLK